MTNSDKTEKPKRHMTEEMLEKLKLAREKALEKRRELAAIRKMERELQLKEKEEKVEGIKAKHSKMNVTESEPKSEPDSDSDPEPIQPEVVKQTKRKKKKKAPIVIVEDSSSDEDSNVVYVKRRSKPKPERAEPVTEPIEKQPEPLRFYGSGFSRRF